MSEGDPSKDDEGMKKMINGLLSLDFSQPPEAQQKKLAETLSSSSTSDLTQQPSSGKFKLPGVKSFLKDSLPNQSEDSSTEIKTLAEWTRLDRMRWRNARRRKQKIPSLGGALKGSPGALQGDVKDAQTELGNQPANTQPIESDVDKGSMLPKNPELIQQANESQLTEKDPAVNPTLLENPSISGENKVDPQPKTISTLENAPEDEHIHAPGYYASSVDWMNPQTNPKEVVPEYGEDEDDDDDEDTSSFAGSLLSKLNLPYWQNINWGDYFPNPFA